MASLRSLSSDFWSVYYGLLSIIFDSEQTTVVWVEFSFGGGVLICEATPSSKKVAEKQNLAFSSIGRLAWCPGTWQHCKIFFEIINLSKWILWFVPPCHSHSKPILLICWRWSFMSSREDGREMRRVTPCTVWLSINKMNWADNWWFWWLPVLTLHSHDPFLLLLWISRRKFEEFYSSWAILFTWSETPRS